MYLPMGRFENVYRPLELDCDRSFGRVADAVAIGVEEDAIARQRRLGVIADAVVIEVVEDHAGDRAGGGGCRDG